MSIAMKTERILIASLLSTAALAGCGPIDPGPDIPEQASYCSTNFDGDFSGTRKVDLGFGPPADFQAYAEGEEIPLITGGQGSAMITPIVRVEKGAGDGPEPCFLVRVEDSGEGFSSEWNVQFYEEGGYLFSDGALYFITYSEGDVALSTTVMGQGFTGTSTVNVVLK